MIIKEWGPEYGTTGWKRIDAPRGVEYDLVEARFHVANAEVFGAATGETQRAKVELDRADRYLQRAEALIADNALPAVKAIRKELSAAKMDLGMAYPKIQASDERIKAELDRLINALHGK